MKLIIELNPYSNVVAEEVMAGYQHLAHIELVFRDMKHLNELPPRKEQRIKNHILFCIFFRLEKFFLTKAFLCESNG